MNTNELIKLIETVKAMGYGHIDISHEGSHVILDEKSLAGTIPTQQQAPISATTTSPNIEPVLMVSEQTKEQGNTSIIDNSKIEGTVVIESPIVGTFYEAASPEADVFVKVGDQVNKGDTVCIIEAMKLMNEIESEYAGEVVEILVSNESGVEYGQPLFRIKPNN